MTAFTPLKHKTLSNDRVYGKLYYGNLNSKLQRQVNYFFGFEKIILKEIC